MRIGLRWLSEYVDIDVPPEKLAELLSFSGTKVEAIHRPGSDLEGVVVAEVVGIDKHPNADSLLLVDVDTGGAQTRVVCGASNFAVGDRVPLGQVGARLPELTIGERKIRGEVSRGMLCSGAELGVTKDHSGILVLPSDAPLGKDVVEVLGLDDVILELELTLNRPDCTGMIGIAREVAASSVRSCGFRTRRSTRPRTSTCPCRSISRTRGGVRATLLATSTACPSGRLR